MQRFGYWLGVFCLAWWTTAAQGQALPALQKSLQGLDATVVVSDLRTGAFLRWHEARLTQAFPPFATFEIPVALAALDARAVRNLNELTPWNRLKYPLAAMQSEHEAEHWAEDHTLRSAFAHSVEWYWQKTSERLGAERLRKTLSKLHYGNQSLPTALAQGWQDDALLISAQAQADFITALVKESLPLGKLAQRNMKDLLLRESGDGYRFYLKTSVGFLQSGHYLGWSLGWLETTDGAYVFALNLTHQDREIAQEAVLSLPKKVLAAAGYGPFAE